MKKYALPVILLAVFETVAVVLWLTKDNLQALVDTGLYSWDGDYLPVLNAVLHDPDKRTETIGTFHKLADDLDAAIICRFGKSVEADLYDLNMVREGYESFLTVDL